MGDTEGKAGADPVVTGECRICYTDGVGLVRATSDCGHPVRYCNPCLASHIEAEVHSKGNSYSIQCPAHGCATEITHSDVHRLATTTVFNYYDMQLMRQMLRALPGFQWCKSAACGSGQITVDGEATPIVTCYSCKARSCFVHDSPWHDGYTCADFDALEVGETEATLFYYQANTKPCPECAQPIQKNDGCDHMTCRKPLGCSHEFCWRCLADYETILREGNHYHKTTCTYYAAFDGENVDGLDA
eukprot:m.19263 g.19263  ORF g.19263 m.19263 type:complete len:245 (+) comp9907_c0_seq1:242-976(+)